jgi:hypothetical protein
MTEEVVRNSTVQVRHQRSVPFCTQRSLLRLQQTGPLDADCPNLVYLVFLRAGHKIIPYYKISHPITETLSILLPLHRHGQY